MAGVGVLAGCHVQACDQQRGETEHARRRDFDGICSRPMLRHEAAEKHVECGKKQHADKAFCYLQGIGFAAALCAEEKQNECSKDGTDKRVLKRCWVSGERKQREKQEARFQRVQRLVELHAAVLEELRVPNRVGAKITRSPQAAPCVRGARSDQHKRHEYQKAVGLALVKSAGVVQMR